MIVFRPLEPDECDQLLHRFAIDPERPLALGGSTEDPDEDRGLCHGCGKALTLGKLWRLRSAARSPAGSFLVLVCAACGAENATARSADRHAPPRPHPASRPGAVRTP